MATLQLMGKVKGLSHRDVRIKIIDLQDRHCNGCKYRYKMQQCLKECEIGKQVRGLGSHLGAFTEAEVKKRRTKAEWDVLCSFEIKLRYL
ncbi:zinc-finger domain-containing protein [Bacillus cereus]|uniref:zinc-finger domain-containing protein n=1 Tax=Bacillus cereus TaxID=1396 RepID=UPI001145DCE7|nr:zinc-finger domain-containing protein [Bacillus cereus]